MPHAMAVERNSTGKPVPHQQVKPRSSNAKNNASVSNKFNFLLEQFSLARKRDECQAGLKLAPLTVQVSALTLRPPALYALSLLLTLIQDLFVVSDP